MLIFLHQMQGNSCYRFLENTDGVIASAEEAKIIRALPESAGKLIVTPGIRPEGAALGDQKRAVTPKLALENGADYLVIGRPIIAAADPLAATDAIIEQVNQISNSLARGDKNPI